MYGGISGFVDIIVSDKVTDNDKNMQALEEKFAI